MAHQSVLRIKDKSWTAGHGKDKTKANYTSRTEKTGV